MQGYIGYIRVSTVKQGTQGVSLSEQRDAISRYAARNQYSVDLWLEEMETAAKGGRPIFDNAMKLLRRKKYRGIILHKLDRGARNLKDWVEIGDLSDLGVEVHFVNESLDLQSRGGRLSADIQAVVSADYIRNLKEEARKGFYGRLKQGIYPLNAPIGYVDQGGGKPKTIDPVMGPLVLKAFELYATAQYNFHTLGDELYRLGLRNRNGCRVTKAGLSVLLNNPFYIGIIRVKKTGEHFPGIHQTLIRKALFDRVRLVLTGKINSKTQRHAFLYRRMLSCARCNFSLIGEIQKGRIYYRCHSKQCAGTSIREDVVEKKVSDFLQHLRFNEEEKHYFRQRIESLRENWTDRQEEEIRSLQLRIGQIKDRLNRLTDAYIDKLLDRAAFEERKAPLLFDMNTAEENLTNIRAGKRPLPGRLEKFLEQAETAWLSYRSGLPEEKRELLGIVTSNWSVDGKNLYFKPSLPFDILEIRSKNTRCGLERDIPRTWDVILEKLTTLNEHGQLPDLSWIAGFTQSDKRTECDNGGQVDNTLLAA